MHEFFPTQPIPAYFEYQIKGKMDIFDRLGLNPARKPDCDTKQLAVNELDFLSDSEDDVEERLMSPSAT